MPYDRKREGQADPVGEIIAPPNSLAMETGLPSEAVVLRSRPEAMPGFRGVGWVAGSYAGGSSLAGTTARTGLACIGERSRLALTKGKPASMSSRQRAVVSSPLLGSS